MSTVVYAFFIPFLVGIASSAVVVLIGVRSIKDYIRERERKQAVGLLEDFWSAQGSTVFNVVFGAEWEGREGEIEPRFGYAAAYGVSELVACLETVFDGKAVVRLVVVKKTDLLSAQLFEENVIIFGGELSIYQFGTISKAFELPYYQYDLDREKRSFQTAPYWTPKESIASETKDGQLVADVGTATRLVNPANGRLVILFNGNYGAGLLGAVLAVSHNNPLLNGIKSAGAAQQLLVKVRNISHNIIDKTHTVEGVRPWVEFNFPADAFQRLITGTAELRRVQTAGGKTG